MPSEKKSIGDGPQIVPPPPKGKTIAKIALAEVEYDDLTRRNLLAKGTLQIHGLGAIHITATLVHTGKMGGAGFQLIAEGRAFEMSVDACVQGVIDLFVREMRIEALAKRAHRRECTGGRAVFIGRNARDLPGGEMIEISCSACGADVGVSVQDVMTAELDDSEGRIVEV